MPRNQLNQQSGTQQPQPASQYAQPGRQVATNQQPMLLQHRHSASAVMSAAATGPAPPIPEPDYSLSESDGDDENSIIVARNTKLNEKIDLIDVPAETSGNSNTR